MSGLGLGLSRAKRFGAGFVPNQISGLELWLDSDYGVNAKTSADFVSANSEYLSSASTDFDKGNESFSFGGWIYADDVTLSVPFSKFGSTGQFSYKLQINAGTLQFILSTDGTTLVTKAHSTTISTGSWYFIVCKYDAQADVQSISLDGGAYESTANTNGAYASSTAEFNVGRQETSGAERYFDGRIDGAFFTGEALSIGTIGNLYNGGSGVDYATASGEFTSLVDYWELNELSGNRSGELGHTLTDNNTVGSALGKIVEQAEGLRVADFVELNNEYLSSASTDFDVTNEDFSFGCWYYNGNTSNVTMLAGKSENTASTQGWKIVLAGGSNTIILACNTTPYTLFGTIPNNQWVFITAVFDLSNDLMKLSINGENFTTLAFPDNVQSTANPFVLGCAPTGSQYNQFDGQISGAFFTKEALSQATVTLLYNNNVKLTYAESAPYFTALVDYWKLNEVSGNRAGQLNHTLTDNNTVGSIVDGENAVFQWLDKSGNSNHVSQSTFVSQPTFSPNGFGGKSKPYLIFDGSDDKLNLSSAISGASDWTVVGVFQKIATQSALISNSSNLNYAWNDVGGTVYSKNRTGYYAIDSGGGSNTNEKIVAVTSVNSGGVIVQKQNDITLSATATPQANAGNFDNIGQSSSYKDMNYCEVLVWNKVLTDTELTNVYRYLNNKYGIV